MPEMTLDELQSHSLGFPYVWVHCPLPCAHSAAIPIHALVKRCGPGAPAIALRHKMRCTVCGRLGASFSFPSPPGAGRPWGGPPVAAIPLWARYMPPTWGRNANASAPRAKSPWHYVDGEG